MSDLVRRLRERKGWNEWHNQYLFAEAADEIERQAERIATLENAVRINTEVEQGLRRALNVRNDMLAGKDHTIADCDEHIAALEKILRDILAGDFENNLASVYMDIIAHIDRELAAIGKG